MFPPTIVCSAAPKFPITLRDLTIIPRTIPKFFTIRYPGNSSALVTIEESTRPLIRSSIPVSNRLPVRFYLLRYPLRESRPLLFSPCVEIFFQVLAILQILAGLYMVVQAVLWLGYVKRRASTDPGFFAPRTAVLCPCKGIEP